MRFIASGATFEEMDKAQGCPGSDWILQREQESPAFGAAVSRARARAAFRHVAEAAQLFAQEPRCIGADNRVDSGWVQWIKTKTEFMRWLAGKFRPDVFGDALAVQVSGNLTLTPSMVRETLSACPMLDGLVSISPAKVDKGESEQVER